MNEKQLAKQRERAAKRRAVLEAERLRTGGRDPLSSDTWQPLEQPDEYLPTSITRDHAALAAGRYWVNDKYEVFVQTSLGELSADGWIAISMHRRDHGRDIPWADKQHCKNQLIGTECEGVEMLPANARLIDVHNTYHLFVNVDPTFQLPFRFGAAPAGRQVSPASAFRGLDKPAAGPLGDPL